MYHLPLVSWFPIQLALRHRPNKHGAQRIVSFVGSPVLDDDRSLKRLADTLRKNTVRGRGGGGRRAIVAVAGPTEAACASTETAWPPSHFTFSCARPLPRFPLPLPLSSPSPGQIHIDVVSIGENGINEAKLQAFVDAVNKDGNQR
jgi:hypothetical protein